MTQLHVRLIVRDADRAIAFYQAALGAVLIERYRDDTIGRVVHAALRFDDIVLALADEHLPYRNQSPEALGGSPVLLQLTVDNVDELAERMIASGAEVLFPVADQFYGKREGRLRDPFGHLWMLSQVLEELPAEEIQRRLAKQSG